MKKSASLLVVLSFLIAAPALAQTNPVFQPPEPPNAVPKSSVIATMDSTSNNSQMAIIKAEVSNGVLTIAARPVGDPPLGKRVDLSSYQIPGQSKKITPLFTMSSTGVKEYLLSNSAGGGFWVKFPAPLNNPPVIMFDMHGFVPVDLPITYK